MGNFGSVRGADGAKLGLGDLIITGETYPVLRSASSCAWTCSSFDNFGLASSRRVGCGFTPWESSTTSSVRWCSGVRRRKPFFSRRSMWAMVVAREIPRLVAISRMEGE